MQRNSQPPLLKRISSLFHSAADKPASLKQNDSESLINKCTRTLVDDHHISEAYAAKLIQGIADSDLYIFLHLLTTGVSPEVAREKIITNQIDVVELRTIESPTQRMRTTL